MQKKKHRKVNFRINHCSSEDPEYPATELLLQSPEAKGWQSKRFSTYPQIIIIELVQPTLLRQISLLSHQSKIASKVEIQAKIDQNKDWKKLGYVSLTSNQNTNFQARQLRTANLNGLPAYLIKLILKTNHVNSQNIFNQVGLISLSIYGDKMVEGNFTSPTQNSGGLKPIGNILEFDKQTLNKLKQLQIRKKQAVDNEEFDLAKNIKQQIERIKNIGQTLILLEQKKQQAIKKQDYETAKIINEQMKKMRDQNQWGPNLSTKPSGNPAEFYKKHKTHEAYQQEQNQQSVSPMSNLKQKPNINDRNISQKNQVQAKSPIPNNKASQNAQKQQKPATKNQVSAYDQDRPLDNNNKTNKIPNQYADQQEEPQKQGGQVQQLSKQILGECQPYFNIFDEEIFCMLYSKDHKNRQNGMRLIKDKLAERITDREGLIEAMLFAIKCTIDDRIASVLITTLQVFNQFMKKLKPSSNSNNLQNAQYILEKIGDYLGHTNQKIAIISQQIYSNLPIYQLTNKDVCYRCLTMSYKRQKPPKIIAAKLKMINKIVTQYQLGKNYDEIITHVVKYVDDKNNDVRTAAINALCAISAEIGYNSVQPFLKNVRTQIIKTIQQQIEATGGQGDDRNHEDKPIKTKSNNQNNKATKNKNQIQTVENEFIDVPKNKVSQQDQYICLYCKKFDKRFVEEDYMDMHFFHSCPMLTICLQCRQTVQISHLTSHLVGECENSKYFKKCPRCKEAVQQKNFKTHVQKKECLSSKPMAAANRCPLCHLDINPGTDGWREHLAEDGCQNNPRK